MTKGYYTEPDIRGDKIAFVSEDDLWYVDISTNSPAVRLTSSEGNIRNPVFNHDATKLAYSSNEYGGFELFVFDLETAENQRLTYLGKMSLTRYWDTEDNKIVFSSDFGRGVRGTNLYKIDPDGGEPGLLPYGLALTYGKSNGSIVLGRYQDDTARWKRYKGGTAGQIWLSENGNTFEQLNLPMGNHVNPMLVNGDIYFLSDFDGVANLYRMQSTEDTPQKITFSDEYYFRKARTDGSRIIMQKAGSLFVYSIENDVINQIEFSYLSSREVRKVKFIETPQKFIESVSLNTEETHAMSIIRGKPFYFPFWEEGTYQIGKDQGVRYKQPVFHPNEDKVFLVSDEYIEDRIEIHDLNELGSDPEEIHVDIGIPYSMKISPTGDQLALHNNRMQIILIDLETNESKIIREPDFGQLTSFDWSPDGNWITYTKAVSQYGNQIFLYSIEADESYPVTNGDFTDNNPRFSPDGKYLYFISNRAFHPLGDAHLFQYDFPKPSKLFAVTLNPEDKTVIQAKPRPVEPNGKGGPKSSSKPDKNDNNDHDDDDKIPDVIIELENIGNRIIELPVPNDRIHQLEVAKDRILFRTSPVKGMNPDLFGQESPDNILKTWIIESQKVEVVMPGISSFDLSPAKSTLIIKQQNKFRLLPSSHLHKMEKQQNNDDNKNGNNRESKYLEFNRIKLKVDPHKEWEQMLKETWKLMKEHYWEENLAGLNWEQVLERYLVLVPKISSRSELSDLLWEMQAETRTSHSYEIGGDYDFPPNYAPAYLGADLTYNADTGGYEITNLLKGDVWNVEEGSPLKRAGLKKGDLILSVDGQDVNETTTLHELLMGKKKQEVYLKIKSDDETKTISIKPVADDMKIRYRDWVESNRQYVYDNTDGKIGYFHIPNMHYDGLQEFYRYFKHESDKDGLIVDVRFNGGGHTSQLFLEKLARQRLGYSIPRYGKPSPYPSYSVPGPIVALTNQNAGSDGDIFSHSFKMMELGTLIGTRTWGGVVGIWPKVSLVDGTTVTQPEYSFWFEDVGFDVENYGTDPDIEVDITPNDAMKDKDPQLDKAIEVVTQQLEENPVDYPDLSDKPVKSD